MFLKNIMWMALLSAMISNVSHAKKVKFQCAADWPSESLEKCRFEGGELRPKPVGSRIARRDLPDLTTVTFFEDDGDLDIMTDNTTTSLIDSNREPENVQDDTSITKRDIAGVPAWPNKWTQRPCCQLTCACYKYLSGSENKKPQKMSEAWKKQRCCYQKILNDPDCANPPAVERFDVVEPPHCLK